MAPYHLVKKRVGMHVSKMGSAFFWRGLRSYIFHVGAESESGPEIKKLKSLLSHPALCFTVEQLSAKDASNVMEKEFQGMKFDLHTHRIGSKRVQKSHAVYGDEVMEVHGAIRRTKKKIFRVKVLIDADRIDRSSVDGILYSVDELRSI